MPQIYFGDLTMSNEGISREIILDTETTGFSPSNGDRIVEIGAVELMDGEPTGRVFHQHINPERHIPDAVIAIHGIDNAMVADKPTFAEIASDLCEFIGNDSKLIAHNAKFDMKFINAELVSAKFPELDMGRVIDTLSIARNKFEGTSCSLDALCERFGVDNSHRTTHGALLDSELLVDVYKALLRA